MTNPHPSQDRVEEQPMSLEIALDFAENPRLHATLQAPADSEDELREALSVLAAAYRTRPESESVTVMREALEPFAAKADASDASRWGKDRSNGYTVSVSLGMCRRAREALARIGRA